MQETNTKKLLSAARKMIAERGLFLSPGFARSMQGLVMSVTKVFKKPPVIRIYEGPPEEVAYTDSKAINVNFTHPLIQTHYGRRATLWEKVNAVKALVMHEAAHIAKTDFALSEEIGSRMVKDKVLWPLCNYADKVENAEELLSCCETNSKQILYAYMDFDNILEDSFINNWLCGKANSFTRIFSWFLKKDADSSPTFEQMLSQSAEEKDKYNLAVGVLLSYAKHGEVIYESANRNHEILNHLREIEDEVDAILDDEDPFFRICHYQKIFCHYWPYLKILLDSQESGEDNTPNPLLPPSATAPTGNGGASVVPQPRSSDSADIDNMMSAPSSSSKSGDSDKGFDNSGESIPDETESPDNGNTKDTAIEKLLNDMADEEVNGQLNAESEKNFGLISKGVNNRYSENVRCSPRIIDNLPDNRTEYQELAKKTGPVTKAMVKYFLQKFRDDMEGERRTGLFSGTGIDWDAEARDELATFYKEDAPGESKPLAVAYLGDESGSMYGEKAEMNRLTAIMVYDFCDALNLPVGIYGHTSSCHADCDFRIYADFRKDPNDRYRMMNIEGDGGNKDGYALRLASERLLAQDSEYKVLIITSDGLPSDYRSREEGIHDIQDCIRNYSRKGIHYIAAAMDADKEQIKQIYGASFLDISDLKTMPKRLVTMLAKCL